MTDNSAGGARVTAVCVVHQVLPDPGGEVGVTAIDKRPVDGAVLVSPSRFGEDRCLDVKHHGGPDQVVYAYADEDAAFWAGELGREVAPGLFGENLRTSGLDVNGAEIGERWRFGDPVSVVHRPGHGVSVRESFLGADPGPMRRLIEAGDSGLIDLHPPLREFAAKVVARDAG